MNTGPLPERAWSSACRVALYTASTSCPSTLIAFMPNAFARSERSRIGECCHSGVDSAQWLSSSTNTAGTFQSCARFSASWNVPMFVAPSPKNATRDARLAAQLERQRGAGDLRQPAADDRVRADVAVLDVVEVHRAAVAVRAALGLAVQLGHQLVRVRALRERVPVRAVRGGDHVAVLERAADADGARLLADRDVEEARAARRRGSAPRPSPRSAG